MADTIVTFEGFNYIDRGAWDPTKVYLPATSTSPGDFVWYMGARWFTNSWSSGTNPMFDWPDDAFGAGQGNWDGEWYRDPNTAINYNPVRPNAPTGLEAGFVDGSSVALFWDRAYVPGQGEVTSYEIYLEGAKVGTTSDTNFLVKGLVTGAQNLDFTVVAVNAKGSSQHSQAIEVDTKLAHVENGKSYSPFIDMTLPETNIVELARESGLRDFTLSFMQTQMYTVDSDVPYPTENRTWLFDEEGYLLPGVVPQLAWGGIPNTTLSTGTIIDQVKQIQDLGGTVTISFGGYTGRDPAVACAEYAQHLIDGGMSATAATAKAAAHLQSLYQSVIDSYGVNHLDFDIENDVFYDRPAPGAPRDEPLNQSEPSKYAVVDDQAANELRNKAINGLRQDNDDLHISITVATLPGGVSTNPSVEQFVDHDNNASTAPIRVLSGSGDVDALIRDLKADGVKVDVINIMAMDYFDGAGVNPDMGQNAIKAATAMHNLLEKLGMHNVKVGITPMLGQNDAYTPATGNEVFTLQDARDLVEFFQSTPWVAGLGAWQLPRDRFNDTDTTGGGSSGNDNSTGSRPVKDSTGVVQDDWEFSDILQKIGLWTPTGGRGNDVINGTDAANTLRGMAGTDILTGKGGNDLLDGGAGMDRLLGGAGTDRLTGGLDPDYFVFAAAIESGGVNPTSTNVDTITDFGGLDFIDWKANASEFTDLRARDFDGSASLGAALDAAAAFGFNTNTKVEAMIFKYKGLTYAAVEDVAGNTGFNFDQGADLVVKLANFTAARVLSEADFI